MVLTGMKAASAVTDGWAAMLAAGGVNSSIKLDGAPSAVSTRFDGLTTGISEIGVSVHGPQGSAGSDCRSDVTAAAAASTNEIASPRQHWSEIVSTWTCPVGSMHTTTPGSAPWLARARIKIHGIRENLAFISHKIICCSPNGK